MAFPEPPKALLSKNPLRHVKYFGPGVIVASVTIGGGETVFASRGGAIFGYSLLWCFVLGALLKAVQVYSSMRMMTLTGHHPVDYWARMRGPRAWFPAVMIVVSLTIIPSMFSALPKFLATLLGSLYRVESLRYEDSLNILASAILIVCAALALRTTYRVLERAQTGIALVFIVFIVAAFLVFRPDLWSLLRGTFSVAMPEYPDWIRASYPAIAARPPWVEIMTYVGIVGGNAVDYVAYLSFIRDKKWGLAGASSLTRPLDVPVEPSASEAKRARAWLRAPRADAVISFCFVTLFSVVFLVLGAVLLAPVQQVPDGPELLTVQARFLTTLHPSLFPLYVIGIVMVFLGTIYGAMELHTRALFECGRVTVARLGKVPLKKFRLCVVVYATGSGLLLIWSGWDPVAILTPSSLVGGLLACGVWCFTVLWADRRFVPVAFRMNVALKLALGVSGVLLTMFGVSAIYDYLRALVP